VVTTNLIIEQTGGYVWPTDGRVYTTTGRYTKRTALPDGCDSLDILDFIVLQVDTTDNEICRDETTRIGVSVTVPEMNFRDDLIPPAIAVGDVLCDDGDVLKPDSFLISGKIAKGIVFYVDKTGKHGRAVALKDAHGSCLWAKRVGYGPVPKSLTNTAPWSNAAMDTNGYGNTLRIKETAEMIYDNDFETNAPAAYYCYYYNHKTESTGSTHEGWYLPAAGELLLLFGNRVPVNATLLMLGKNALSCTTAYWTSTANNANNEYSWHIQYDGYFHTYGSPTYNVRAIVSF
jgi:hypothetical protein